MTKLEELRSAVDDAWVAYSAARDAAWGAATDYDFALVVYRAELNKIQPSRAEEDTRGEL
jgi:hypothetical protein